MKILYYHSLLQLKYPFAISKFARTSTPVTLVEIHYEGLIGYGEACLVPYLGENHQSATCFLNQLDLSKFHFPFDFEYISYYLETVAPGNCAIKAAIDIALHDLLGKILNKPCYQLLGINPVDMPITSYTIGIDTPEIVREKAQNCGDFQVLKVKLGTKYDKTIIQAIREVSQLPLYVDANEGWKDKNYALEMIVWLREQGVVLIEQPMPKDMVDENAWLTEQSPLPTIGDEAVQRIADVGKAEGVYSGINVKLMKSTGIYEALEMIKEARRLQMSVLIGCMSETSCAALAGATLAPLCDWADLDGPFLISNNPFQTPQLLNGKYMLPAEPGLGLVKI